MAGSNNIPGKKVPRDDYFAFVPAPLPPKFEWTPRPVRLLSEADRLVGKLDGEGGRLPNPHAPQREPLDRLIKVVYNAVNVVQEHIFLVAQADSR